ncbi:MAG: hypothetical protein HFE52_07820 [Clostridia bacterium]|nr:hypothetical protein [Clostridia bacterium]
MSPREKQNSQKTSIFFSPKVLDMLRTEAESKGTTISGLVRMIVLEYFENKKK